MNRLNSALFAMMIACFSAVLSACGGASPTGLVKNASNQAAGACIPNFKENPDLLSPDQKIFESFELNGGSQTLSYTIPSGGGNLVRGTNYFVASKTSACESLQAGPELEQLVTNSLDSTLDSITFAPTRVLLNGEIFLNPTSYPRRVSLDPSGGIRADYLANDFHTVTYSLLFSRFESIPLSGTMSESSEDILAIYPMDDWVNFNNFAGNAKWQDGAAYLKKRSIRVNDTYLMSDCKASSPYSQVLPSPCSVHKTLEQVFPIYSGDGGHASEVDFIGDGTISMNQGVRMWVAKEPRPMAADPTVSYRIYFELNGNIYKGLLQKANTPIAVFRSDGTVVDFSIALNQAAVSSVQKGLITGAVLPGADAVDTSSEFGTDLFGIGGHGVNGSLSAEDLRSHYHVPETLTGAGQTIAVIDAPGSGDPANDLKVYSQYNHLPVCDSSNPCFEHKDFSLPSQVDADSAKGWGGEVAMDIELIHAMAPGAKIILVTAASGARRDLYTAVNAAVSMGVTAISMSFGSPYSAKEDAIQDKLFADSVKKGMIFFASTGDNGAVDEPIFPSSSASVTAVGGTTLQSVDPIGPLGIETGWQFSGGGESHFIAMPSWQGDLYHLSSSALANLGRLTPDVSAVADFQNSAVGVYHNQSWVMNGGTSASAPIWAGISALIAEAMAKQGKSLSTAVAATPGGFNPMLYQIHASASGANVFFDVKSGSNNLKAIKCSLCTAQAGFDLVTGLGSPDVRELVSQF